MTRREEVIELMKAIILSGSKTSPSALVDYTTEVITRLDNKLGVNKDDKDEIEDSEASIDKALKAVKEKRTKYVGTFSIDNIDEALEKVKQEGPKKSIDLEVLTAKTTQVPLSVINKTLKKGE